MNCSSVRCDSLPESYRPSQVFRRRDGRVAEGARLESVFTRKGNVGSNPTLSASFLFVFRYLVYRACCCVLFAQGERRDLRQSLRFLFGHNIAVHIHRGANISMPHELLLYRKLRTD
jgi:hypothetical protein